MAVAQPFEWATIPNSSLWYDLRRLMSDKVMIYHQTGQDSHGSPTYGDPVPARCRIDHTTEEIRTKDGKTRTPSVMLILDGIYNVQPEDRIVMPSGDFPTIARIKRFSDGNGPLYEEILG